VLPLQHSPLQTALSQLRSQSKTMTQRTVNNYEFGLYDDGEVWIQTEPRQLEAASGKVFLTVRELRDLLALASNGREGQLPKECK
jgi:hypothetical protein